MSDQILQIRTPLSRNLLSFSANNYGPNNSCRMVCDMKYRITLSRFMEIGMFKQMKTLTHKQNSHVYFLGGGSLNFYSNFSQLYTWFGQDIFSKSCKLAVVIQHAEWLHHTQLYNENTLLNTMCEHVLPREYTSITQKKHTWNPRKQLLPSVHDPILCLQAARSMPLQPPAPPLNFPSEKQRS